MLTRELIAELWRELVKEYIHRCRNWKLLTKLYTKRELLEDRSILDTSYGVWGLLWHESDLVNIFGYNLFKLIINRGFPLHIHFGYTLKPRNFSLVKDLYGRLVVCTRELRRKLRFGKGWYPEIDMIISDDRLEFKYCFEFKYYHYYPKSWDIVRDLKRKSLILNTLREYDICKDVAIVVLDDGVCRANEELCKEIDKVLTDASKNHTLVLKYYVSYTDLYSVLNTYLK